MNETKANWNWRDDDDGVHRLYDGDEPITLGDPCFDTPEQEELLCLAVNAHDDMLSALEAAVKEFIYSRGEVFGPSDEEIVKLMKAAIAKAKGGSK